jgi:hypothetical protein
LGQRSASLTGSPELKAVANNDGCDQERFDAVSVQKNGEDTD